MRHDDHLIFEAYKSRKLLKEFDISKDWPAKDNEGKPRPRTSQEVRRDFNDAFARRSITPAPSKDSVSWSDEVFSNKADALVKDLSEKYGPEVASKLLKLAAGKFDGENEEQMLLFPDPKPAPAKTTPAKKRNYVDYGASMADAECVQHPEKCVP